MLQRGGSAVDAILATAIALSVVEPTVNGIGSDLFALVWDGQRLHGLNGSGRAPAALTLEALNQAGHQQMPERGWWTVTVPGAPRAWADLHERFGRLRFAEIFEPAIGYAEQGYPVSPITAGYWQAAPSRPTAASSTSRRSNPGSRPSRRVAARRERATPGAVPTTRAPCAASLHRTVDDFYAGELAEPIERFAVETGGPLRAADLAAHTSDLGRAALRPATASTRCGRSRPTARASRR